MDFSTEQTRAVVSPMRSLCDLTEVTKETSRRINFMSFNIWCLDMKNPFRNMKTLLPKGLVKKMKWVMYGWLVFGFHW